MVNWTLKIMFYFKFWKTDICVLKLSSFFKTLTCLFRHDFDSFHFVYVLFLIEGTWQEVPIWSVEVCLCFDRNGFHFSTTLFSSVVSVNFQPLIKSVFIIKAGLTRSLTQLDLANPSCLYFPRVWRHVRSGLVFVVFPWELSSQWWSWEQDSNLKYTWQHLPASLGAVWRLKFTKQVHGPKGQSTLLKD